MSDLICYGVTQYTFKTQCTCLTTERCCEYSTRVENAINAYLLYVYLKAS
jgi:hypothetical protein